MTKKRYYKKDWEESYYIFDSNTISEDEFEEKVEYKGYDVFADSLTVSEIIGLLNENEQLKEQLLDANELNGIYVDFLVDKGFELSDVVEWSKRS